MSRGAEISITKSIVFKLLKIVFSIYVLVAFTVTLIHMGIEYFNVKNNIEVDLKLYQNTFEDSLATALWDLDEEQFQTILPGILKLPSIVGVQIQDLNQDIVSAIGFIHAQEGEVISVDIQGNKSSLGEEGVTSELFWQSFPIYYTKEGENTQVGTGIFYSNTAIVIQRVQLGFVLIVINSIIKTTALWVIFLWVSRPLLIRPLTALTNAARELTLDNLEEVTLDIKTKGHHELKILEEAFNLMIKKLHLSGMSLQNTLGELNQSKNRLELLLDGTKEVTAVNDKFTAMVNAVNAILNGIPTLKAGKIHIYFQDQGAKGIEGYAYFQIPFKLSLQGESSLQLDSIKEMKHSFTEILPAKVQEIIKTTTQTQCVLSEKALSIPIWQDQQLHAFLEIETSNEPFTKEDSDFVNTLSHSLAISLESITFTLSLEQTIYERTQELEGALEQLETQFAELQVSNSKLKDLDSTKNKLLEKMNSLNETVFPSLEKNLNILLGAEINDFKDSVRHAVRDFYTIEETLRPYQSLYLSEQAIQSKRVLLAETIKKQQMIAKMALGGTGVELDIVDNIDEGLERLKEHSYDILCVNMETIELTKQAVERYPDIKTVFMTSEDVPAYLPILQQYPFLSNIVSRNDEDRTFTLKNISTTVSKLTTGDFFGLEKYLNWGVDVKQHPIIKSENRSDLSDEMASYFKQLGVRRPIINKCGMVTEELIMNAIYDAPVDAQGKERYNHLPRTTPVELKSEEQGIFRYACEGLLVAVSIEDPFGALNRETILTYLESCYEGRGGSLQKNKGGGRTGAV